MAREILRTSYCHHELMMMMMIIMTTRLKLFPTVCKIWRVMCVIGFEFSVVFLLDWLPYQSHWVHFVVLFDSFLRWGEIGSCVLYDSSVKWILTFSIFDADTRYNAHKTWWNLTPPLRTNWTLWCPVRYKM